MFSLNLGGTFKSAKISINLENRESRMQKNERDTKILFSFKKKQSSQNLISCLTSWHVCAASRTKERTNGQTNKRTNERASKQMNTQRKERTNEGTTERSKQSLL